MAEGEQPGPVARGPSRKAEAQAVLEGAPWKPAPYAIADAAAIQALQRGDANADQQRRALKWLIETCCGTYDLSYRPGGEEGARDTAMAEGKRWVGLQVVKLLNNSTAVMRRTEPRGDSPEPRE